ncbi:hypothetical protein [Marinobacter sp.]|uniref:beta strand repeat-containing protein n=1 Tax=Marinobacter sp. TaxID=50741 RepID=UPI00235557E4|nr:hypothetical protein [Marinobacter sp.]
MFGSMGQTNVKNLGNGGTMDGDVTITGDLTVSGGIGLSLSEVIEGTSTIDVTNTEALLVRKNGDGGDVFIVDTTNEQVKVGDNFIVNASGDTPVLTITGTRNDILFTESDTTDLNTLVRQQSGLFRIDTMNDALDNPTRRFTIEHSTGNVSIGSSSPSARLHILGTGELFRLEGANAQLRVDNSTTDTINLNVAGGSDSMTLSTGSTTALTIDSSQNTTLTGNLALSASSPQINFSGSSGDYGTFGYTEADPDVFKWALFQNSGQIASITIDAVSEASPSARFRFNVGGDTDSAIVIDSSKRVGIGTDSPTQLLHIASSTDAFIQLERVDTSVANNDAIGAILFRGGESSIADIGRIRLHADADFTSSSSPTKMIFETTPSGSTVDAVALTIDSNQNVAIGKSALESTDSNWSSLELGGNGALINHSASGAGKALIVSQNAYMGSNNFNTGMDYMDTDEASCYLQHSGTHTFRVAGSGTADASITWTDALVIANDGSSTFSGDVNISKAGNATLNIKNSSDGLSDEGEIGTIEFEGSDDSTNRAGVMAKIVARYSDTGSGDAIDGSANEGGSLGFFTSIATGVGGSQTLAEKMRIENNGNVAIGTASPIDGGGSKTVLTISDSTQSLLVFEDTGFESSGDGLGMFAYNDGTLTYRTASRSGTDFAGSTNRFVIDANSRISLSNNDSGTSNTIFGKNAGDSDGAGDQNVFVGELAGGTGTQTDASDGNVGVGYNSLTNLTSGYQNTAIGSYSSDDLTSASFNTAVGRSTLASLTTGVSNVAVGRATFSTASDDESYNIAIGSSALGSAKQDGTASSTNREVKRNIAIGEDALKGGTLTGTNHLEGNIAIGYQAMDATGANNQIGTIAIGTFALGALTSGENNTVLGYETAKHNVTGGLNTWVGYQAGLGASGQSNSQNTGVGYRAGYSITTGSNNTFLGRQTGLVMTTGSDNTFVGMNAGMGNVSGVRSVSIGNQSMLGTVTADGAVAVGYEALKSLTSGAGSVGIGYRAGDSITSGDYNTAIGYGALGLETTGDRNTAVGYNSLQSANGTNNASNTAVGFESGNAITSGFHNVTIGSKAGNIITTGDYNVMIGGESDPSGNNAQNQIVIGYNATGQADNSVTLGNSSVTDVYMAQDSGATVHCDKIQMLNYRIIQKDFGALSSGSSHDIGTANANFAGTIKMWTNHNSGSGYIEYSLVYSTNAKALSLIHQNQPYAPSTVTLSLDTSTGTISTSSLSYNTDVHIVIESMNTQFTFA